MKNKTDSTIMVVYGATGDLMARKILPAIFGLNRKKLLPKKFKLIGFARRPIGTDGFRKMMIDAGLKLNIKESDPLLKSLLSNFNYHEGNFNDANAYSKLKTKIDEISENNGEKVNLLHYLAVPPSLYETIFLNIGATKLNRQKNKKAWTKLIIEKPFGNDLKTAKKLEATLKKFFKEDQIFRIDHYLGKKIIQNIISLRFNNNIFENNWGNKLVEKIEVFLWESIGIENRGEFFDSVGALRDVGQNHVLQMLALVTMDKPKKLDAKSFRESRFRLLKSIKKINLKKINSETFRAQFKGYTDLNEIASKSTTETFFRIETEILNKNWNNVPIILEGGKNMPRPKKEIIITFKHSSPCHCPSSNHQKNQLKINLDSATISMGLWFKKPGIAPNLEKYEINLGNLKEEDNKNLDEYERLIFDCFKSDQLLFVSAHEVLAMWRFIDPILTGWSKGLPKLIKYESGSYPILNYKKGDL